MITISPGHFGIGTGAVGFIDEVEEAIKVVNEVARILKAKGIVVHKVFDETSKNRRDNLRFLARAHAKTSRKVDIFVHFNATEKLETRSIGTEVFYKNKELEPLAKSLSSAISEAAGFKNRGAQNHEQLYVLNPSSVGGVLLDLCVVNSIQDV
ncbi:MAG: N-acetylmuramoyl-L-alanine amidase, partial [Lysinibacillus sp.]